ncbi:anthrax toxin-like adenylyl cyclase domain-containing protein [Pandoraea faecigallinarum]|uniref:anthrax toxin-like adenylyl cyclase domain-containing protein n=1 Tax=Pandoraea faecigallinarum TaxID=656179 RepID=UPI001428B71F|nr:anthrax toxin-like adenylyl cyclase domain-containing protein [Pandoraea faecigallinarum]
MLHRNDASADRSGSASEPDIDPDAWRIGNPALDSLRRTMLHARNVAPGAAPDVPGTRVAAGIGRTATPGRIESAVPRPSPNARSMPLFSESLQRVANQYKVVIGLRQPNTLGQSLLREGFPTKNFHVKAKTSATGPTAGFVPHEPKYAKVGLAQWEKQANAVADALRAGAKAVNLRLSQERVTELVTLGAMTPAGGSRYGADFPCGTLTFSLRSNGTDTFDVLDAAGHPVKVLTNPPELSGGFARDKALRASPLPITADYDLFCLFSSWQRDVDQTPMPVQPHVVAGPKMPSHNRASQYLKAVAAGNTRAEDPNMGNISLFHRTIVDALNAAVIDDGYRGGKLFWHNTENGNPFSPGFSSSDAPIFFVPGKRTALTASSLEDLNGILGELRELGYAARLSPRLSVRA